MKSASNGDFGFYGAYLAMRVSIPHSFSMGDFVQSIMGAPKSMGRLVVVLLTINAIFMGIPAIPESFSQEVTDDEIKAALVFKFPVYVRWPDAILDDNVETFEFLVLGKGRLSDLLGHFDGEKIMGKIIHVKRISTIQALEECHMLFIASSEEKNLAPVLKAIEGKPILTVGDMNGFAQQGGVINFIRKKDSIHFEINREAGKRAGLNISSKLLRLAKIVKDHHGRRE